MGQTTSKGKAIGFWFNGHPVYESDMTRIDAGVASGKYVPYTDSSSVPSGYEPWITLNDPSDPSNLEKKRRYARKMNGFKQWWIKNKAAVIEDIINSISAGREFAKKVAAVVLPVLLDAGIDAAKQSAHEHFGDNPEIDTIVEILATQVKSAAPGATYVMKTTPIKRGGNETNSDYYFGAGGVLSKFGAGGDSEMDLTLVNNYVNGANSKAKQHIINAVIEVAEKLKMKVSGATPEEKIKSILMNLPTAGNFKKELHKTACEAIAMRLNSAYGSEIVSTSLPAEVVCGQVAEVLNSLSAGMHSEFIAVYNDARRVLRNLQLLTKLLDENHGKLVAELKAGDEGSRARAANYESIHSVIKEEIDRQSAMLNGLINGTLSPVDGELSKIMSTAGIKVLTEQIDLDKPGTASFSRFLASLIKGMGVTAHLAALIENALKTVGMTMAEYSAAKSTQQFREKIAKNMSADMSDAKFNEYLRAAELLFENLERRAEVAEAAAKSGASDDDEITGAAEYEKSAAERRAANRKTEQQLYFNTFHKEINALFDGLLGNINILSAKIGEEIPLSENLDQFRRILQRIHADEDFLRKGKIYKALTGFFTDVVSKQKREEFISKMKTLASAAMTLAEMGQYASSRQYFVDVRTQVEAIIKLIESYSEKIAARFGRGEPEVTGGSEVSGGGVLDAEPQLKYRSPKTLSESIEMFDFKYRLAHIRDNLKMTAEETPGYFKDHENLVAQSISEILRVEKEKYDALRELLDKQDTTPANFNVYLAHIAPAPADDKGKEKALKDEKAAAGKHLDLIWETKKAFWLTIEAADAYLREFTVGMVSHPGDIRDIRSMVESVEVIAEWYSEKSGNRLNTVFNHMPATQPTNNLVLTRPDAKFISDETDPADAKDLAIFKTSHTNQSKSKFNTAPSRGLLAVESAGKFMQSWGLLKNFISIFNKIGSKFGGESLSKKIPMSPATMYENLRKFICVSSLAQGHSNGKLDATGKSFANWATVQDKSALFGENPAYYSGDATLENTTLFRQHWFAWFRRVGTDYAAIEGDFSFVKEDEYFVTMIKALAAKILAIVNLQDIMVRPADYSGLTTARIILGAADDEIPKVENDLVPLYPRLLLLAQFYRRLFAFSDDGDVDKNYKYEPYPEMPLREDYRTLKISMVPDIDGTFSEIVDIVFRKKRFIKSINYSDDDIKDWIRAVNLAHQRVKAKKPTETFNAVINEFVAEINRRYGIVTQASKDEIEKERLERYGYKDKEYEGLEDTELPLLEGEGDDLPSRPSASMALLSDKITRPAAKKSKYTITRDHEKLIRNFRNIFENYFDGQKDEQTLGNSIALAQKRAILATDDKTKFGIVSSLIRGVDVYNKIDAMKYVMLHETVISGLNVLSGIHTMLERFRVTSYVLGHQHDLQRHAAKVFASGGGAHITAANLPRGIAPLMAADVGFDERMIQEVLVRIISDTVDTSVLGHSKAMADLAALAPITNPADQDAVKNFDPDAEPKTDAAKKLAVFMRHRVSFEAVMNEILELLYSLTNESSGLIKCDFKDKTIFVNFGSLKKVVEGLFANVLHHIELLRPHLSTTLIEKYTDGKILGSYFWLYKHLMDDIFNGVPKTASDKRQPNIEECSKYLTDAYTYITQEFPFGSAGGVVKYRHQFGNLLANKVFYECDLIESGLVRSEGYGVLVSGGAGVSAADNKTTPPAVVDFITHPVDSLHVGMGADGKKMLDTRFIARFHQLYKWGEEFTFNRSVLFAFNQLVAKFIESNYDPVTSKMYAGTINNFSQSIFNRAIIDYKYTYPDVTPLVALKYRGTYDEPYDTNAALEVLTGDIGSYVADFIGYLNGYLSIVTSNAVKNKPAPPGGVAPPPLNPLDDEMVQQTSDKWGLQLPYIAKYFAREIFIRLLTRLLINFWRASTKVVAVVDATEKKIKDNRDEGYNACAQFKTAINNGDVNNPAYKAFVDWQDQAGNGFDEAELVNFLTAKKIRHPGDTKAAVVAGAKNYDDMIADVNIKAEDVTVDYATATIKENIDDGYYNLFENAPATTKAAVVDKWTIDKIIEYGVVDKYKDLEEYKSMMVLVGILGSLKAVGKNLKYGVNACDTSKHIVAFINEAFDLTGAKGRMSPIVPGTSGDYVFDANAVATNRVKYVTTGNFYRAAAISTSLQDFKYVVSNAMITLGKWAPLNKDGQWPIKDKLLKDAFISDAGEYNKILTLIGELNAVIHRTGPNAVSAGSVFYKVANMSLPADRLLDTDARKKTYITAVLAGVENNVSLALKTALTGQMSKKIILEPVKTLQLKGDELITLQSDEPFNKEYKSPTDRSNVLLAVRKEAVNSPTGPLIAEDKFMKDLPGDDGNGWPWDQMTLNKIRAFGNRRDPDGDHVLFTSLADIIKNLISSRTSSGAAYYLQENIADLPSYMKERMRANLPAFSTLFRALIDRCELLKSAINATEVDIGRTLVKADPKTYHNPWPFTLLPPQIGSKENKTRFIGILESVIKGCEAFIKSCEQVVREIGDTELYLETYQGSIKDYKLRNEVDPLMPVSSMLNVMNNVRNETYLQLFPLYTLGENKFKFMYGTRLLLNKLDKQPLLEHAPGYMYIIDAFNMMVDDKFKADKKQAEEYFKHFMKSVRFFYETRRVRNLMCSSYGANRATYHDNINVANNDFNKNKHTNGSLLRGDLVLTTQVTSEVQTTRNTGVSVASPYKDGSLLDGYTDLSIAASDSKIKYKKEDVPHAAFAIGRSIDDIIRITESSARNDRIKELVESIIDKNTSERSMEISNIIDLNIVPINVHALAREIPLATLYNYAYSFDLMVNNVYRPGNADDKAFIKAALEDKEPKSDTPGNVTAAMLINPYISMTIESYKNFIMSLRGTNNFNLGRPKFLSDQLFEKVMLGDLYSENNDLTKYLGPAGNAHAEYFSGEDAYIDNICTALTTMLKAGIVGAGVAVTRAGFGALDAGTALPLTDEGEVQTAVSQRLVHRFLTKMKNQYKLAVMASNEKNDLIRLKDIVRAVLVSPTGSRGLTKGTGYANSGLHLAAAVAAVADITQEEKDDIATMVALIHAGTGDLSNATLLSLGGGADAAINTAAGDIMKAKRSATNFVRATLNDRNNPPSRKTRDRLEMTDTTRTVFDSADASVGDSAGQLTRFGLDRLNTKFIRNLVFITNVYRTLALILRQSMSYVGEDITRDTLAISDRMTEFTRNARLPGGKNNSNTSSWKRYNY